MASLRWVSANTVTPAMTSSATAASATSTQQAAVPPLGLRPLPVELPLRLVAAFHASTGSARTSWKIS